eukprot:14664709-Alexandrium_andersonii.AAC.1
MHAWACTIACALTSEQATIQSATQQTIPPRHATLDRSAQPSREEETNAEQHRQAMHASSRERTDECMQA